MDESRVVEVERPGTVWVDAAQGAEQGAPQLPAGRQRVPVGDEVGEVFGSLLVVRVPCGLELRLALGGDGAARGAGGSSAGSSGGE
ncbi:hypothetical protein GCM10025869_33550 [Homoserinibacter gongjuensis]|uniref:Uncharacterized protein n=1 Tax=Homoserinibacter gongjuensis TaxID=1162968 RepID=A0ABQ6K234_9MICO|nr:hypothetical protein GCM10025869_33550 [Homoserinibacter gongjuensis]